MSVAWVGAGIAAVGTISGAVAGNKAQKNAKGQQDAATALAQQQADLAQEQYQDYKDTYQPLEKRMVDSAQNYDSPEAYAQAASKAQATTSQQIGLAQDRLARTPGLDPSSGAAQAAQTKLALSGAALGATNQNAARTNVRDTAWARKMDALGLGKGLVTNASNGLSSAARTSASLADAGYAQASSTASGVAAAVTGLGTTALNAYKGYQAAQAPVSMPASSLPSFTAPTIDTTIPGLPYG
jgi:hypothetical protein